MYIQSRGQLSTKYDDKLLDSFSNREIMIGIVKMLRSVDADCGGVCGFFKKHPNLEEMYMINQETPVIFYFPNENNNFEV